MDDRQISHRLALIRPAKCFAIVDGDRREIAVPVQGSRRRWLRVIEASRAIGADGIECVDSSGAVVDVIAFDSSMSGSTSPDDGRSSAIAQTVSSDVERIVAIVIDAQDRAVQRHGEHVRIALDALARVCEAVAERAERLERALAALAAARDAEGDTSQTDRLAALAMAMLAGGAPGALDGRSSLTGAVNGSKKTE